LQGVGYAVRQIEYGGIEVVGITVGIVLTALQVSLLGFVDEEWQPCSQFSDICADGGVHPFLLQHLVQVADQGRCQTIAVLGKRHQGSVLLEFIDGAGVVVRSADAASVVGLGQHRALAVQCLQILDDQIG
jgi:hypothetical protein